MNKLNGHKLPSPDWETKSIVDDTSMIRPRRGRFDPVIFTYKHMNPSGSIDCEKKY